MKMLTDEQKKMASQAFEHVDIEKSGTIPRTVTCLAETVRLAGLNPTEVEVERHMSTVIDEGAVLNKEQFLGFISEFTWRSADEVREGLSEDFRMFTETGTIDPGNLIHILTKEGRELLQVDDIRETIETFSTDRDGNINIQELVNLWLSPMPC